MGGTVTWPKKHKKHSVLKVPKKVFFRSHWNWGWGGPSLGDRPPPPPHGGDRPDIRGGLQGGRGYFFLLGQTFPGWERDLFALQRIWVVCRTATRCTHVYGGAPCAVPALCGNSAAFHHR